MNVRVFASIGLSAATVLTGAATGALVGFIGYGLLLGTDGAPAARALAHVEEQIASLDTAGQCLPVETQDRLVARVEPLPSDVMIC